MSKIKILYIGINYQYFNRTNTCLLKLLEKNFILEFYGPGFSSQDELNNGLEKFVHKNGPYNFYLASKDIVYTSNPGNINQWIKKNTYHTKFSFLKPKTQNDICRYLEANREKTIVSLLDVDIYSIRKSFFDDISNRAGFFIGFGNEAINTSDSRLEYEPFIQKKIQSNHIIGENYFNFAKKNNDKLIRFGHLVADEEVNELPLLNRPYDASVPGVKYLRRLEALNAVSDLDFITLYRENEYFKKLLYKFPKNRYLKKSFLNYYDTSFKKQLLQSKSCITDGGIIDLTVRKFLEIPASGSLLICWPTSDLIEMGFEHEKNSIFIESSKDLEVVYRSLKRDIKKWQQLATEGQKLVLNNHTITGRSNYLNNVLENIINSNYSTVF